MPEPGIIDDVAFRDMVRLRRPARPLHPMPEPMPPLEPNEALPEVQFHELPEGPIKSSMPPFKLPYDSQEAQARLCNSLIICKGNPYIIRNIHNVKNGPGVLLRASERDEFWCRFADVCDVRTPPACYITYDRGGNSGTPMWLCRIPSSPRDNYHNHGDFMQGLTTRNGAYKTVGRGDIHQGLPDLYYILKGLKTKEPVKYHGKLEELLSKGVVSAVRLTDYVAVFFQCGKIKAEYRGRELGVIRDERIQLSDEDRDTPWIMQDILSAGLGIY